MEIIKKIQQKSLYSWVLGIVAVQLVFPSGSAIAPARAAENDSQNNQLIQLIAPIHAQEAEIKTEKQEYQVTKTYKITITAYSSTADQTDSTPCITANGYNLCEHNQENVIAANFLPFGTKVRIPEYFGDRIFTVQDRMNARYYYRGDVWFKTRQDAIKFGAPYTDIEVVEEI